MTYTPNLPAANALIFIALILAGLCIVKLRKMNKEIASRPKKKIVFIPQGRKNKESKEFEGFIIFSSIFLIWAFILAPLSQITLIFCGIFFTVLIIGAFSLK